MKVVERHITAKELKEEPEEVFDRVWREMVPKLYRFALTYVMNYDVAEDVVQHAFMMLWNKMRTLPDDTVLNAWLYAVVKNACLGQY